MESLEEKKSFQESISQHTSYFMALPVAFFILQAFMCVYVHVDEFALMYTHTHTQHLVTLLLTEWCMLTF